MTLSQASTQRPQLMQAKLGPSRMSMPIGQTEDADVAGHAVAGLLAAAAQLSGFFGGGALFAPIVAVVDGIGLRIPDRALEAGPRTHEGADLVPRAAPPARRWCRRRS